MHHWIHSTSTEVPGAMLFEINSVETIEVDIVCVIAVHRSWWHICSGKNWGLGINDLCWIKASFWCADFK